MWTPIRATWVRIATSISPSISERCERKPCRRAASSSSWGLSEASPTPERARSTTGSIAGWKIAHSSTTLIAKKPASDRYTSFR